jgi:hypothetical protein
MATTSYGVASWGITNGTTVSQVSGIVTDYSLTKDGSIGTEQNEVGAVIKQVVYDKKLTVNVTVVVAASANPPEYGAEVNVKGTKFYVTNSSVTENNMSFRKIAITAERYQYCDKTVTP